MPDRPMVARRAMLAGALAMMTTPALPAPYHPLPDGLTVAFFREAARKLRANARAYELGKRIVLQGADRSSYYRDLNYAFAGIFDRMGDCREPFDLLEKELYAAERALMKRYDYRP
ncbi:hypothetical protein [uncultured Alsobacter sp.]|uniref:hypothetical protein n=1 Tax=uncultured Alsobacter sp. TaxID=1748258 RepID=UPI0025E95688|nr:hypothetical protein [uncultured Alsobacter sp.]